MNFDTALFFSALGLALVLEGAAWALFPATMVKAMRELLKQPYSILRVSGISVLLAGLFLVWLSR